MSNLLTSQKLPEQESSPEIKLLPHQQLPGFITRHQNKIVLAICIVGVLRLFFFCSIFPVFNSTDEELHFDMVHKYARGFLPASSPPSFDREALEYIYLYHTLEYLQTSEYLSAHKLDIPYWKYPPSEVAAYLESRVQDGLHRMNAETFSPPAYYAVAALWYKVGRSLGIHRIYILYWVRFLNPLVYGLFLAISYIFVKSVYPDDSFLQISVPMVLAFFPQDVFYGINREILSPLCSALALFLLLRIHRGLPRSMWSYFCCGFAISLAVLVDYANVVLFGVLFFVVLKKHSQSTHSRDMAESATLAVSAALPLGLVLIRNYMLLGDATGARFRAYAMDWTLKPLSEVFHHPIFTFGGASYFLTRVIETFWRGEYFWHLQELSFRSLDIFYQATSAFLLLVFTVCAFRSHGTWSTRQFCNWMCLFIFLSSVMFLALLSLPYDFHECFYPSRALPYFASGRIIIGALLPFVIMYLIGLREAMSRMRIRISPLIVVIALMFGVFGAELAYSWPVFGSPFNLPSYIRFHPREKQ